ncbi:MAG TPA: hypothetical protein IGS17_19635 [Oscillatoriales cyanobacterium M59_W2019_021]|nr:MAG: hypothetical protein D6728_00290 [Cyanobacteria bacterium J055]HIK33761.1 hypothetical protein [Oscillatoriales cyanobacterium M4454_W2019_049]HIK53108.1 hypothetical protein [Oscillatoriales cyanobacterium M59_W2019_021]
MTTDYLLFVHGVNVRERLENEQQKTYRYADSLFDLIQREVPSLQLRKVPLYWANVSEAVLRDFQPSITNASAWQQFWYKDFRTQQLLPFTGDAALYISRHVGSLAVEQLKEQAFSMLTGYQPDDRLHLVTHSWGTVILFDMLFASRWDDPDIPGHQSVQDIRRNLFGVPPGEPEGIRLASINTMGSPLAMFSLITLIGRFNEGSSHDISPKLENLLANLTRDGNKIPWQNFVHPGDPIALPLEKVVPILVDRSERYIDIQDILVLGSGWLEMLAKPLKSSFLSLVNGGNAHNSYWNSLEVARAISKIILTTSL